MKASGKRIALLVLGGLIVTLAAVVVRDRLSQPAAPTVRAVASPEATPDAAEAPAAPCDDCPDRPSALGEDEMSDASDPLFALSREIGRLLRAQSPWPEGSLDTIQATLDALWDLGDGAGDSAWRLGGRTSWAIGGAIEHVPGERDRVLGLVRQALDHPMTSVRYTMLSGLRTYAWDIGDDQRRALLDEFLPRMASDPDPMVRQLATAPDFAENPQPSEGAAPTGGGGP